MRNKKKSFTPAPAEIPLIMRTMAMFVYVFMFGSLLYLSYGLVTLVAKWVGWNFSEAVRCVLSLVITTTYLYFCLRKHWPPS